MFSMHENRYKMRQKKKRKIDDEAVNKDTLCCILVFFPSCFSACSSESGVCQTVGKKAFNAGMANSRLHYNGGVLFLNLSGGDDCHHVKKKRETIISFVCSSNYSSQDTGRPVFIYENDCVYYVTWHTSVACESQVC